MGWIFDNSPLVQCVPNFSEGRDSSIIAAIVDAARVSDRVRVVDWSADADHNRMVVTLVGAPQDVADAACSMASVAVERIDLRGQVGVHPRLGAIDVLPFVPLREMTLDECALIARQTGERIASALDLPVFYYEASSESLRTLPDIRKRAFTEYAPDAGPNAPHPTAGALVCGARGQLIAFNVNLIGADLATAKRIAREVRSAYPGRVRALGLWLASREVSQVSMNITAPEQISLIGLIAFIEKRNPVLESELIGALPGYIAFDTMRSALKMPTVKPGQVLLETWSPD